MQGQLFTQDFLRHGIRETPPYQALGAEAAAAFEQRLRDIFAGLTAETVMNEAQTEQLVIERVLVELGWGGDYLPQVNLSGKRREDVPDILLFADAAHLQRARDEKHDDRRYRHGLALLEAKRWLRPLDRGAADEPLDPGAPSSQMLRYLSRADVASDRAVKWGVLTNGGVWRLYWQDARSRAEEFLELDVAAFLGVPGVQAELDDIEPAHGLRLFFLLFNRAAFLTQTWDTQARSFHAYARAEARAYEEKVSRDLGERVFNEVFPTLAQALARGDLEAKKEPVGYGSGTRQRYTRDYLDEVREATLILLYRLLFLFYAEDRRLLPVGDERYRSYSVRALRERVRDDIDAGKALSSKLTNIWRDLQGVFWLIDEGDDTIGMPAYNGGLFNRGRSRLLERTRVPDAVLAPIIDALSRRTEDLLRGWINYRDLSVSHLGSIYERLLEYQLQHEVQAAETSARGPEHDRPEIDRVTAVPASFARKVSGSYYTHDDLVQLILRESVGLLAAERVAAFDKLLEGWKKKASLNPAEWERLDAADPASTILELKICDPAMGSGHFLVALVDFIADKVLEAATTAQQRVAEMPWAAHLVERGRPWEGPLLARLAALRGAIKKQARQHGWAVADAQLDDRHIVRRMVLKKCVFGVDKNGMAVELAKTALWLHGERLATVQQGLQALGMLFQQAELQRLELAAKNLQQVADFTDVDIAEARLSQRLASEAHAQVAPVHALLDFWRAMRWLLPGWPVDKAAKLGKLGDEGLRAALTTLLDPARNLVATLAAGTVEGDGAGAEAARALLAQARALAAEERFFHWWTAFPTAFAGAEPGFDAVIGNPPWDMLQMQEVEWFAERVPEIAVQTRASDRKRLISELSKKAPDVWQAFQTVCARAETEQQVFRKSGDYPLLAQGRMNLYQLFVERAMALTKSSGLIALLTPSGIAADSGAAKFFSSVVDSERLGALLDFENKGREEAFFRDVHDNFKFVTLVFGAIARRFQRTRCAFYLHSVADLDEPGRVLELTGEDFALVNPNTRAAPVFRYAKDAELTVSIYRRLPVLVRHRKTGLDRAWPVRFAQGKYNMSSDSKAFKTSAELVQLGFSRVAADRWASADVAAVPLLVGKMIWNFDHRANSVSVNSANVQVAASSLRITSTEKQNPHFRPEPQYWVLSGPGDTDARWVLSFRDITNPTNVRTAISAIVPHRHTGNTLCQLLPLDQASEANYARSSALLLAILNSLPFDYVTRQKAKWTHLNWFILEQLPVVPPARFDDPLPAAFTQHLRDAGLMNGHHPAPTIADFVLPQVLALSYTAHDLAPFARDLGYVDEQGQVLPPIRWDDEDRRRRLAALDALFFWLYGLGPDDAAYVLDSFPIVRQQDEAAFGRYRTKDDVLALLKLLPPPAG